MNVTDHLCRVALLPDCHVQPDSNATQLSQPTRRLYGVARHLLETHLKKLKSMKVDAILLLGDTLDPADARGMKWLKHLIDQSDIPIHPIIGNHETWGSVSPEEFHLAMGLPADGHYLARIQGIPFLMLATPDQDSLSPGSKGDRWLKETLEELSSEEAVFCCAHFSLLLHPCVQGSLNDGMQVLWAGEEIMALLKQYPTVRGWIAGHKNIPSKVIRDGIIHLLSPQLIQAPCGYRVLDIFPDKVVSTVHAIEEEKLAECSRQAYGSLYPRRHGREEDRNFSWSFASSKR